MKPSITIRGIEDVDATLKQIAPRQAVNLMRSTIHSVAGEVRKDARKNAPRDDGDLRKSIKSKRRRVRDGRARSDVLVAPAAFYWRFLEYGQGPDGVEHAFFLRALEGLRPQLMRKFLEQFGKKLEAAIARAAKRNG